jgi:chemotaxis family two-component system response regulator Rcp1
MNSYTPIHVLLVDDDEGDIELTREAFLDSKIQVDLDVCYNGAEALSYLKKEGEYSEAKTPDLILLDLNMPIKDGRETLMDIKKDETLRKIPVVILTTSQSEEDVMKSYDLGCNCYVSKPVDIKEFSKIVKVLEEFWFTIVKLPHAS